MSGEYPTSNPDKDSPSAEESYVGRDAVYTVDGKDTPGIIVHAKLDENGNPVRFNFASSDYSTSTVIAADDPALTIF